MLRRLFTSGRFPAVPVRNVNFSLEPSAALLLGPLLVVTVLSACKPPPDRAATQGDGSVTIVAELVEPPAIGPAPVVVRLTDPEGEGIDGASVRLEGDMTHAGMVPVLTDAVGAGDGVYRADDMHFTMAGDWIITITVTADGKRSSSVLLVNVPAR